MVAPGSGVGPSAANAGRYGGDGPEPILGVVRKVSSSPVPAPAQRSLRLRGTSTTVVVEIRPVLGPVDGDYRSLLVVVPSGHRLKVALEFGSWIRRSRFGFDGLAEVIPGRGR